MGGGGLRNRHAVGDEDAHLALIAAPYADHGRNTGSVGVIGPTRMAYDRMIQIVDITSRMVGQALSQR